MKKTRKQNKTAFTLRADDDGHKFNNEREIVSEDIHVDIWYPDRDRTPTITVGLMDVRAADDIIIEYDFEEDGYKIFMDRTVDAAWGSDVEKEKQLVAFIPSWNDVDHDDVIIDRREGVNNRRTNQLTSKDK